MTHRRTHLERKFLLAVMVLMVLTAAGQSADLVKTSPTSPTPHSNSSLITLLIKSSAVTPKVQLVRRPCGREHSNFCLHDGECVYPQDSSSSNPSCICKETYTGKRCETYSSYISASFNTDQVIAIVFGVIMVVFFLGLLIFLFAYRRCRKSTPHIKLASSETSV
ncbi:pro-neuregulin-4, membrane-bound isoform [Nematolebias whitei]|uniref:pro-neuregulin-4, membrane-bound isoform n=1 Tax=Nematolebias whitei TaxID=451745 RepID=UPI00189704FB|nr:pro-neuregulin-4, membrane-bound isoform [Nematolebias whitei]